MTDAKELITKEELEGVKPGLNFITDRYKIYLNNIPQWAIVNKFTQKFFTIYASKNQLVDMFKLESKHFIHSLIFLLFISCGDKDAYVPDEILSSKQSPYICYALSENDNLVTAIAKICPDMDCVTDWLNRNIDTIKWGGAELWEICNCFEASQQIDTTLNLFDCYGFTELDTVFSAVGKQCTDLSCVNTWKTLCTEFGAFEFCDCINSN